MDAALSPPIRLQPVSVTSISARSAQKRIDAFLEEYQSRSMAPSSACNTAVTHQLKNLRDALQEESRRKKAAK
ncbi:hypothetical protein BDZ89DRAFT_1065320 [Hymenopellis radicata]|nr:hypothetical protein BDZ89DRAFT_1065320 [Hymenopellis radicata]